MSDKPNLLLIHSDQHNPFVAGCYGDGVVQTPNLDRLAMDGVVFDNAYCSSPICVPSRMSMLTSRHPHQNGVWTNEHILDSGIPTFAHALGAAGYRPILVGRMHALGPDQLHGYVERLVGDHSSNHLGGAPVDRGVLDGTAGPDRVSLQRSGPGQNPYQVHDEAVTAAPIDYVNRLGVQKRSGAPATPFCLSVGFMLPHPPYVARRKRYEVYRDRIAMPKKPKPFSDERHPHLRWWRQVTNTEDVSEDETLRARAAYWALVAEVDGMLGQILTALENNGLLDDTLIVYTSDHGDMLGEHGLWWKHTFYEESARVPLIMSWPGVITAGQRCGNVVSALDVTATMLDALGAPALPNAAGRSFLKLVNGTETDALLWEDEAFTEYCSDEYAPPGGCFQRMVRRGDWKLIYYHGQPPQLFNLAEDPDELTDRAGDLACQEIQRALIERVLDGWDPRAIKAKMDAKRADNQILKAWARRTHPGEQYRWDLRPEMSRLEI